MPAEGGTPQQVTHHTAGQSVEGWYPDGQSLLISANRDHNWRDTGRFFRIGLERRGAEELWFDSYGEDGDLAADGKTLLFTREGVPWWRKGYHGSRAAQIWKFDRKEKSFTKLLNPDTGARWPLWRPDGRGFYYVGVHNGVFNLREHDLVSDKDHPLTEFNDDDVVFPCLSRNGTVIVFRHLFDFYRFHPFKGGSPERIAIIHNGDAPSDREIIDRRVLEQARQVALSPDGLEIAVISGGDLWVMDTVLMEPRQVTTTPEEEARPSLCPRRGCDPLRQRPGGPGRHLASRAGRCVAVLVAEQPLHARAVDPRHRGGIPPAMGTRRDPDRVRQGAGRPLGHGFQGEGRPTAVDLVEFPRIRLVARRRLDRLFQC